MAARGMLLAAAAAAATGCAMGNPAEATGFDEGKVVSLHPENFDEQIKKLQPVLVDFYACVLRRPPVVRSFAACTGPPPPLVGRSYLG
jgi:hypothetical protein